MEREREMQQPTVLYLGHSHRLTVLENMPDHAPPPCDQCRRPCDSPPVFHCAQCDFNLHLLCGPLPTRISLPDLLDEPLSLADSYAEDDSGEYYCDLCEEKRDPRECVYHFEEYYFVHLKCAMPQVLSALKGERGDVELRTLGKLIPGKVVSEEPISQTTARGEKQITESTQTLKEIYESFSENELMEVENLSRPPAGDSSDSVTIIPPVDEDLAQLLKRLNAVPVLWKELIESYNLDAKVVDVEGHQITWDFAYIMKGLMDKHEELKAESSLSPKVKTFVSVLLCDLVYRMYRTNIEDVTEQMLMNWWRRLKVVQRANFQVQFITNQLTRVVIAHFGLAVKKSNEDTMASLDEQIDKLSKELNELKERREQHQKIVESASTTVTRCLAEASDLSWKTVGADLL